MRNEHGPSCAKQKRQRDEKLHISTGMSVFKQCSYMCYSNWCWFLKSLKSPVDIFHIHIFFIAPRMSKSTVPSFLEFGQEMTEYGEYWQLYSPHYLSRAIVDFFSVCLKENEASWWRYQLYGHQYGHHLLSRRIRYLLWRLHSWTAQMLRPVKETSQIHNCKIVVEGFFWPISPTRINGKSSATIINKKAIYFVLIYHTLNTCFVPPEHLHQVVCEEDHQSMDCSHCYHQADLITEPSLADCKTRTFYHACIFGWFHLIKITWF